MSVFGIELDRIINSSQAIAGITLKIKKCNEDIESIKLDGVLEGRYRYSIDVSIRRVLDKTMDEAARLDSFGKALQEIERQYSEAEKRICGASDEGASNRGGMASSASASGTDKRNFWQKIWDWITRKEPDEYKATTSEQEKAADDYIRARLKNELQDEKYSQENWDRSSIEQRKQILQDYMDKVIDIYGLKDVKHNIVWDAAATYTATSITWGYYNHGSHKVTLNERALSDSEGSWDSYDLLETVSHELRHAYQHEAIDHPTDYLVSKETIDSWDYNFKHYIDSSKDYNGYRAQVVEVDARSFQVNRGA